MLTENISKCKAKAAGAYLAWTASASEKAVKRVSPIKKIVTELFSYRSFLSVFL